MPKILVFDPVNPAPSAEWRTYNGLDFLLNPLLVTDLRRIRKAVADLGLDEVAAANELDKRNIDHIIRDWRGPVTPAREKLPLTATNKFGLVNAIPGLRHFAQIESDRIAEAQMIRQVEELGNSASSPAGSTSDPANATGGH